MSGRSQEYCVNFSDPLRGKIGNFLQTPPIVRMSRIRTVEAAVPATPKLSKGGSAALS
jgi:hypothetical protein